MLQNLKRIHQHITPSKFFTWSSSTTIGHSIKQYYPESRVILPVNIFLSVRVVQPRNKLPEEVISVSSVRAFITRLNSIHVSF